VRTKVEDVEVDDPKKAMERFESLLGNLVKVPKSEVHTKRKPAKVKRKRKR
jgi:hypothetical protein